MIIYTFDTPNVRAKAGFEILRQMSAKDRLAFVQAKFRGNFDDDLLAVIRDKLTVCRDFNLFLETLKIASPEAHRVLGRELAYLAFSALEDKLVDPWKIIKGDLDGLRVAVEKHVLFARNKMAIAVEVAANGQPQCAIGSLEIPVFPLYYYMDLWNNVIHRFYFSQNRPVIFQLKDDGTPSFYSGIGAKNVDIFDLNEALSRFMATNVPPRMTSYEVSVNMKEAIDWSTVASTAVNSLARKLKGDGLESMSIELFNRAQQAGDYFSALSLCREYGIVELEYPDVYKESV